MEPVFRRDGDGRVVVVTPFDEWDDPVLVSAVVLRDLVDAGNEAGRLGRLGRLVDVVSEWVDERRRLGDGRPLTWSFAGDSRGGEA